MSQTLEYTIKANAEQAKAALADVEKRFGGVANAAMRTDRAIIELEKDIKDLNAAIAAGGPNVEHYKKALQQLQMASGQAVGSKGPSGQGLLQLSQTLDDLQYGIRGVVNNIPGLVQGFGMGAGVAGAAQLAFIAVNTLTDKITNYIKKQQEATQAAIKFRLTMLDMRKGTLETTVALQERLDKLNAELKGGDTAVAEVESAKRLKEIEENISNSRQQIAQREAAIARLEGVQFKSSNQKQQIEFERATIRNLRERIKTEEEEITQLNEQLRLKKEIAKAEEDIAESKKKQRDYFDGVIRAESDPRSEATAGMFVTAGMRKQIALNVAEAEMEADIDAAAARKDLQMESLRTDALIAKTKAEIAKEGARKRVKDEKDALREIEAAQKKSADFQISLLSDTAGQMTSAFAGYLDAKIKGEEDAEAKAVASFLSATGQQLVASGTRGIFEGAIMSANPATPGIGAGMIATGTAAVVAGLAMAGGGAAISSSIAPPSGGVSGSGRSDPGAAPRSGGSGGGGPLIINVSYGAGGPLPEDIGREIAKAVGGTNRRRGSR